MRAPGPALRIIATDNGMPAISAASVIDEIIALMDDRLPALRHLREMHRALCVMRQPHRRPPA